MGEAGVSGDPQAAVALMATQAKEQRGISVVHLAGTEYMVSSRGAMTVANGVPELRALLARMGVCDLPPAGTWQDYEARRREWRAENPGATCGEYETAMRSIADELGL